jgi:hypothetical protein
VLEPWKIWRVPILPNFCALCLPTCLSAGIFLVACHTLTFAQTAAIIPYPPFPATLPLLIGRVSWASPCRHHCAPRPHTAGLCAVLYLFANRDHSPFCSPSTGPSPLNNDSNTPTSHPHPHLTSPHLTSPKHLYYPIETRDGVETCWPRVFAVPNVVFIIVATAFPLRLLQTNLRLATDTSPGPGYGRSS